MNMIPTWLQPILEAKGVANTDGIGRHARTRYCRNCGVVIIRGLDDDRTGLTATCDPYPLDGMGEVLALMAGRTTYQLTWRGRYELDRRDEYRIAGRPPGPGYHVVAEHRCGSLPLPTADQSPPPSARRETTHDRPPF